MPELPEVQTVVTHLHTRAITGVPIEAAEVYWERTIVGDRRRFVYQLQGSSILDIFRRGKFIGFSLDRGRYLLMHLRMSGSIRVDQPRALPDRYVRVRLRLTDGRSLVFRDPRKFGRIVLTTDPESVTGKLGVEPLSPAFSPEYLLARLRNRRRRIKPLLLDQHIVAGLGNIYVDEVLWEASIHPARHAQDLTDVETRNLVRAVRTVLSAAIRHHGTGLGSGHSNFRTGASEFVPTHQKYLQVFQRSGCPCPRCGTPIVRIVLAQRGTHLCPACQIVP